MKPDYLDGLDKALAGGVSNLSKAFGRARGEYVRSRQCDDGGFRGRRGGSDIYYTDLALRTLALVEPRSDAFHRAAGFVANLQGGPKDIVECFSRLNSVRLLRAAGEDLPGGPPDCRPRVDARQAGTYDLFLGALCCRMLAEPFPETEEAVQRVRSCGCPDGGFGQTVGGTGQTNATAAAVGVLAMADALTTEDAGRAAEFLAAMQTPTGGLAAHEGAPEPDLLSTFTALVTLSVLDRLEQINLPAVGRFVRAMAGPDGGFRACRSDPETDVEYSYYGLGTAALLRHLVTAHLGPSL
ncbi:MAG: prenyltransferase/squalene oxidase repeat-containing protein [Planctomycetota bacterium]